MPKFFILCPEEVELVHVALKELFREAGRGSIRSAEERLGLHVDYYSTHRRKQTLDLGVLLATLQELAVDPGDFLARIFGGGDPSEGKADQVSAAYPRRPPGWTYRQTGRSVGVELPAIGIASQKKWETWFAEMDGLRYSDPEAALFQLRSRAADVPELLAAHYLAICGSCSRMIGNLCDARECLELALDWAERNDEVRGDILQRLAYIEIDGGSYEAALELAQLAAGLYIRTGNLSRLGRALVDQAKALIHLGQPEKAREALDVAKGYIEESDSRNRFAIEQFLAAISKQVRDFDACLEHTVAARKLAPSRHFEGMALAPLADTLRELGRLDEAATAYREQLELLDGRWPLSSLLATVDLVDVLARQGKTEQALLEATTVTSYVGCLKGNHGAEAALLEVFRSACAGVLRRSAVASLRESVVGLLSSTCDDSLGARVRRCRQMRRITREEAAVESGVPVESLRKIETGVMPGTLYESKLRSWLAAERSEMVFATKLRQGQRPAGETE